MIREIYKDMCPTDLYKLDLGDIIMLRLNYLTKEIMVDDYKRRYIFEIDKYEIINYIKGIYKNDHTVGGKYTRVGEDAIIEFVCAYKLIQKTKHED